MVCWFAMLNIEMPPGMEELTRNGKCMNKITTTELCFDITCYQPNQLHDKRINNQHTVQLAKVDE